MNKVIINLRYFLTPLLIVIAMLGIVYGGIYTWLGVAMFASAIVLDWATSLLPVKLDPAGVDEDGELNGVPWLLNAMMYAQYPIFVLLQLSLVWRDELNTFIDNKEYIVGEYSFADVHWTAVAHMLTLVGEQDMISSRSNLNAWFDRVKARSSYVGLPSLDDVKNKQLRSVA
ncbi:MAG: hypothetical protein P8J13_05115 [Gammaproteobacteria bacterium]|nr:hypothetical protein [Gammaproteobacteria bacterium]